MGEILPHGKGWVGAPAVELRMESTGLRWRLAQGPGQGTGSVCYSLGEERPWAEEAEQQGYSGGSNTGVGDRSTPVPAAVRCDRQQAALNQGWDCARQAWGEEGRAEDCRRLALLACPCCALQGRATQGSPAPSPPLWADSESRALAPGCWGLNVLCRQSAGKERSLVLSFAVTLRGRCLEHGAQGCRDTRRPPPPSGQAIHPPEGSAGSHSWYLLGPCS